jgi:Flp pilus assembly protein TadG
MRRPKNLWRDDTSSALLESAIVVPVLFALVLETLVFSYFSFQQHLSTGVRDAARYLARTDPIDGWNQTTTINLATTGSSAGGSACRVPGFDPDDITVNLATFVSNVAVSGVLPFSSPAT